MSPVIILVLLVTAQAPEKPEPSPQAKTTAEIEREWHERDLSIAKHREKIKQARLLVPQPQQQAKTDLIGDDGDYLEFARPLGMIVEARAIPSPVEFDQHVFSMFWPTREDRIGCLKKQLRCEMELARRSTNLSIDQIKTLQLAGMGDIQRFLNRVEAERVHFEEEEDQERRRAALKRLQPLAAEFMNGPFQEGSLFAKTLERIDRENSGSKSD